MENLKNSLTEKKRKRSANWESIEKNLLRNCMKEYVAVIENKNTDTNTNKAKNAAWQKITQQFNELSTKERNIMEIKQQWRTMKLDAKKKLSIYKRQQNGTGGGQKPPSPGPEINEIINMIPQEFEVDFNQYDSNSIIIEEIECVEQKISYNNNALDSVALLDSNEQCNSNAIILNKENIEKIVDTPVSNINKPHKKEETLRSLKRKLPFEKNDYGKKRTEVLISCVEQEHELKIEQMKEVHEWNKTEHILRVKNLELENIFLTKK